MRAAQRTRRPGAAARASEARTPRRRLLQLRRQRSSPLRSNTLQAGTVEMARRAEHFRLTRRRGRLGACTFERALLVLRFDSFSTARTFCWSSHSCRGAAMLRVPPRAAPPTGGAAAAGTSRTRCALRCGAAAPRAPLHAPLPRAAAPALALRRIRLARLRTPTPRARLHCAASASASAVADDASAAAAEPPALARFDADELTVLLIAAVVFLDRCV
jgi:hypothetical protein